MQKFEPDQLVLVKYAGNTIWRLRRYSFCDGVHHETQDGSLWDDNQIHHAQVHGDEMMTEAQIQQAVDAAQKARREFFADQAGVRMALVKMLARYNIEVWFEDVGQPPRKDGNKYILTLPNDTSALIDHYTLAHEMGHIIMMHSIDDMKGSDTDEDKQANIFAAELLMPEKEFREACHRYKCNRYRLSDAFGVMPSAAGVRMAILGIEEGR